jgi:hypothetical protein
MVVVNLGCAAKGNCPIQAVDGDLDFEGATVGEGFGLEVCNRKEMKPLLRAGRSVLAGQAGSGIYISSALLEPEAQVNRRAAFAVFLARAIQGLAGGQDDPVVLTARRAPGDPLWAERAGHHGPVNVVAGDRAVSNLMEKENSGSSVTAGGFRWPRPAGFEILLFLAVVLFMVEGVLHGRGRIS